MSASRFLKRVKLVLGSCLFGFCMAQAQGAGTPAIKVVVAGESWAHLLYADARNAPQGLIADFIRRMNEVQDKFHFELFIYPRLRLDQVFLDKEADVYPLRTPAWTTPALGLLPTKTIMSSGDVYFAKKSNHFGGRKIFDNLKTRMIAGVRGYHYQLFSNNPDEAFIRKHFNAYFLNSNEAVVQFILADRADVGIVPEVIIAKYLEDPVTRDQLIVGNEFDSHVELSNLVRKGGPISVEEMNVIVELLIKSGDVARLKEKLSIQKYQAARK